MNPDVQAKALARQKAEEMRYQEQQEARQHLEQLGEDITTTAPPEVRVIIPDILPCASTIVSGAGHGSKTTAMLLVAIRISLGLKFCERDCRKGRVLYAFGEDSTNDVRRIVHLLTHRSYPESSRGKRLNDGLRLLNVARIPQRPPLLYEVNGTWRSGGFFDLIERIIEEQEYSAVILDTLSSLGLPESQGMNDAAAAYHLEANRIAEQHNVAFVGLHHVSQHAAQNRDVGMYTARGATAIADNARCVIQVQKHEDSDPYQPPIETKGLFVARLHVVKHKWSTLKADTPLWITSDNYLCKDHRELTGDNLAQAKQATKRKCTMERLDRFEKLAEDALDLCQERNMLATADNIASVCELGLNRTRTTLKQMAARGYLKLEPQQRKGPGRPADIYRCWRYGEEADEDN